MLSLAEILQEDSEREDRYEIFRGMCEAVYQTEERKRRGKGTQGLVRNQALENTMHSLAYMCSRSSKASGDLRWAHYSWSAVSGANRYPRWALVLILSLYN